MEEAQAIFTKSLIEGYFFIFLIPFLVTRLLYWGSIFYFKEIPFREIKPVVIGFILRVLVISLAFAASLYISRAAIIIVGIGSYLIEDHFIKKLPVEHISQKSILKSTLIPDLMFGLFLIISNFMSLNSQGLI